MKLTTALILLFALTIGTATAGQFFGSKSRVITFSNGVILVLNPGEKQPVLFYDSLDGIYYEFVVHSEATPATVSAVKGPEVTVKDDTGWR